MYLLISIHAPLAGRDESQGGKRYVMPLFQSTRPLRGATGADDDDINERLEISIHAPLAGRDIFAARNNGIIA